MDKVWQKNSAFGTSVLKALLMRVKIYFIALYPQVLPKGCSIKFIFNQSFLLAYYTLKSPKTNYYLLPTPLKKGK